MNEWWVGFGFVDLDNRFEMVVENNPEPQAVPTVTIELGLLQDMYDDPDFCRHMLRIMLRRIGGRVEDGTSVSKMCCQWELVIKWCLSKAQAKTWQKLLVYMAEILAKQTDNDLDDALVQTLKEKLNV